MGWVKFIKNVFEFSNYNQRTLTPQKLDDNNNNSLSKKKKKIDRPKLTHAGREYLCESSGTHNKREKSLAFNLHFHQLTASIFAFRLRRRKVSPIFRSNLQFNLSSNFTNVYVEICGSHQFATFLTKVLFFI